MKHDPDASAPLFLPAEFVDAYAHEARRQVESSRPVRVAEGAVVSGRGLESLPATTPLPAQAPRPAPAPSGLDAPLVSVRDVVKIVAAAWALLVLFWGGLAVQRGSLLWLTIAGLGAAALLLTVVGLRRPVPGAAPARRRPTTGR